jgi:hypothetical protein
MATNGGNIPKEALLAVLQDLAACRPTAFPSLDKWVTVEEMTSYIRKVYPFSMRNLSTSRLSSLLRCTNLGWIWCLKQANIHGIYVAQTTKLHRDQRQCLIYISSNTLPPNFEKIPTRIDRGNKLIDLWNGADTESNPVANESQQRPAPPPIQTQENLASNSLEFQPCLVTTVELETTPVGFTISPVESTTTSKMMLRTAPPPIQTQENLNPNIARTYPPRLVTPVEPETTSFDFSRQSEATTTATTSNARFRDSAGSEEETTPAPRNVSKKQQMIFTPPVKSSFKKGNDQGKATTAIKLCRRK